MLVNEQCLAYLKAEETLGRKMPPPPLGGCEIPIVEDYLQFIKPGMHVLEIGCGAWGFIKSHCEKVGAHYEGIDTETEYFGKKSVATRFENLADLSFSDEYFDIVIGNQTMEHWEEHGCRLSWGLYQCFRVCKPSGMVLMNVPIYFHGTEIFLMGKLDKIKELFVPFSQEISCYTWGKPSSPFTDYIAHPSYWKLHDKPAYILDIHANKDKPLPVGYNNKWATNGLIARLRNNPPSYIIYRLLCALGIMPKSKE
jgi:hypothetical protein